ncbi:MAG TPA: 4-hydroxythreonine-4-phosphate dehydrogenase PdxA [Verrucomicrobiota bacterium]|nr:4-hydroxythreonine-4-phosphate dehydrogenase PdxA [Verrucomicrobiota bacterium]HNT13801.1 4-hydroxythreonine-4-phosphate dehydrogenase PdxA [Verrucomicrobiota bacterium]
MAQEIGIALGDITGIGPEVTLKALAAELPLDDTGYVLFGEPTVIRHWNDRLHLALPLGGDRLHLASPPDSQLSADLPPGAAPAARAAVAWLRAGATGCLQGKLAALVTAPVNKAAIIRAGQPFVGQTEFLSELAQARRTAMMLLGTDARGRWLRVALATVHIAIKTVPQKLTTEKIRLAIELAAQACRDLGLARARIAVCGLNPHAGEGGQFGTEEITTISPIVQVLQQKGFDVVGPMSGDTVFHYALQGDFDAVVAMYHDQGLAPLKAVAFDSGINWTLGLPFIRTSPDHGTAYNIAGQGIANPSSMMAALRLAKKLAHPRR